MADEAERLRGEVADQEGLFLQISEAKQEADELRDQLAAATQVGPESAARPTGDTGIFRAITKSGHAPLFRFHVCGPWHDVQQNPCCSSTVAHSSMLSCQTEQSLQQRVQEAEARAAEVQQQLSNARQELSDAQQQLAAAAQAGDASATMQVSRLCLVSGC